jgi:hypothetical protein
MAFAIAGGKSEQENSGQHEPRSEPARMRWKKLFHDLSKVKLSEGELNEVEPGDVTVNESTPASHLAPRFTFLI